MTIYVPTVIAPGGPFDGALVDNNLDDFQTATCNLDATNFAATQNIDFPKLHKGASTETFFEDGSGSYALYNAWAVTTATLNLPAYPYPDGHDGENINPVSDTEVSFVARKNGVAFITSVASLHDPRSAWILPMNTIPPHTPAAAGLSKCMMIEAKGRIYAVEGVSRQVPGAAPIGEVAHIQWSTSEGRWKRVGQEVRVSAEMDIIKGRRYSVLMKIELNAFVVDSDTGHGQPEAPLTAGIGWAQAMYFPAGSFAVSIFGGARQTSVVCVYTT